MKSIIFCFLFIAAVSGQEAAAPVAAEQVAPAPAATAPLEPAALAASPAAPAAPVASAPNTAAVAPAAPAPAKPANPFGPAFFGPGLNNPNALPADPIEVRFAQQFLANKPNLRARVDPDGSLVYTDQFGREVDEALLGPEFEALEQQQELEEDRLEREFFLRRQQLELQLRRELGLANSGNAAVPAAPAAPVDPAAPGAPAAAAQPVAPALGLIQ